MTCKELRDIVADTLDVYLGGDKVWLSDQTQPERPYPYIYFSCLQQHMPGPANESFAVTDSATITRTRREQATASFSFTACSLDDGEALDLADRAHGFFLFSGIRLLSDQGVVPVSVQNCQNRSAFEIDETDRRYGFDVTVRYERTDERDVPSMRTALTYYQQDDS